MKWPDAATIGSIARLAGERIMTVYAQAHIDCTLKADHSPVTSADMAAHLEILHGLRALTPTIPVISEEDLPTDAARIVQTAKYCWLVDPLDGTRDFLSRSGDFTVNIALMEDAKPVMGCVYAPVTDDMYLAERGQGATREKGKAKIQLARTRHMNPEAFVALVSNLHLTDENERLARIFPKAKVRRMGSSLKYVTIAAGEADVAVRLTPTSLWDTAAAQCVLEEAGGAMVTIQGQPLEYTHGGLENPSFMAFGDRALDPVAWLAKFKQP